MDTDVFDLDPTDPSPMTDAEFARGRDESRVMIESLQRAEKQIECVAALHDLMFPCARFSVN